MFTSVFIALGVTCLSIFYHVSGNLTLASIESFVENAHSKTVPTHHGVEEIEDDIAEGSGENFITSIESPIFGKTSTVKISPSSVTVSASISTTTAEGDLSRTSLVYVGPSSVIATPEISSVTPSASHSSLQTSTLIATESAQKTMTSVTPPVTMIHPSTIGFSSSSPMTSTEDVLSTSDELIYPSSVIVTPELSSNISTTSYHRPETSNTTPKHSEEVQRNSTSTSFSLDNSISTPMTRPVTMIHPSTIGFSGSSLMNLTEDVLSTSDELIYPSSVIVTPGLSSNISATSYHILQTSTTPTHYEGGQRTTTSTSLDLENSISTSIHTIHPSTFGFSSSSLVITSEDVVSSSVEHIYPSSVITSELSSVMSNTSHHVPQPSITPTQSENVQRNSTSTSSSLENSFSTSIPPSITSISSSFVISSSSSLTNATDNYNISSTSLEYIDPSSVITTSVIPSCVSNVSSTSLRTSGIIPTGCVTSESSTISTSSVQFSLNFGNSTSKNPFTHQSEIPNGTSLFDSSTSVFATSREFPITTFSQMSNSDIEPTTTILDISSPTLSTITNLTDETSWDSSHVSTSAITSTSIQSELITPNENSTDYISPTSSIPYVSSSLVSTGLVSMTDAFQNVSTRLPITTTSDISTEATVSGTSSVTTPNYNKTLLHLSEKYWIRTKIKSDRDFTSKSAFQQTMESQLIEVYKLAMLMSTNQTSNGGAKRHKRTPGSATQNFLDDSMASNITVRILNITIDSVSDEIHLIYVIFSDELPVSAIKAVKYINLLSFDQMRSILNYRVLIKAEVVKSSTQAYPWRRFEKIYKLSDQVLVLIVFCVLITLLIIFLAYLFLYCKRSRKDQFNLADSPALSNYSSASPQNEYDNTNRQKMFADKSFQINVTGHALDIGANEAFVKTSDDRQLNGKVRRKKLKSNMVDSHKDRRNKMVEGQINPAFIEEAAVHPAKDKSSGKQNNGKKATMSQKQIQDGGGHSREPVDKRARRIPDGTKLRNEILFDHVQPTPLPADDEDLDATVLNRQIATEKLPGKSEAINMQVAPSFVHVADCTTTESTDDAPCRASHSNKERSSANVDGTDIQVGRVREKINQLLDDAFSLASSYSSSNDGRPYSSYQNNDSAKTDRAFQDRKNDCKLQKLRNSVSSVPSELLALPAEGKYGSNLEVNASQRLPPDSKAQKMPKSVWTPYTAGDEVAQMKKEQSASQLVAPPIDDPSHSTKTKEPAPPLFHRTPKNFDRANSKDEIDVVSSLKSFEFQPADSVIKAIQDELKKYESSSID
ncbi:Uncharacterised protein g1393 [Pycnogonum litorale]